MPPIPETASGACIRGLPSWLGVHEQLDANRVKRSDASWAGLEDAGDEEPVSHPMSNLLIMRKAIVTNTSPLGNKRAAG